MSLYQNIVFSQQSHLRIEVHFFVFVFFVVHVLRNKRTLVTCKSCEVRSASQSFTPNQCPFISQCTQKKCTSILIFMLKR